MARGALALISRYSPWGLRPDADDALPINADRDIPTIAYFERRDGIIGNAAMNEAFFQRLRRDVHDAATLEVDEGECLLGHNHIRGAFLHRMRQFLRCRGMA